jgi:hypothetical protein
MRVACAIAVMNDARFPLNDRTLYEGAGVYPGHQLVGYLNFPLSMSQDAPIDATLVIAPVVEDEASSPSRITVSPVHCRFRSGCGRWFQRRRLPAVEPPCRTPPPLF